MDLFIIALNGLQNNYDKYMLFSDGAGPSNMERLIGLNRWKQRLYTSSAATPVFRAVVHKKKKKRLFCHYVLTFMLFQNYSFFLYFQRCFRSHILQLWSKQFFKVSYCMFDRQKKRFAGLAINTNTMFWLNSYWMKLNPLNSWFSSI